MSTGGENQKSTCYPSEKFSDLYYKLQWGNCLKNLNEADT